MALTSDGKFEKKLLLVWKMNEEFGIFLPEHSKSLKIGTLVGSFYPK